VENPIPQWDGTWFWARHNAEGFGHHALHGIRPISSMRPVRSASACKTSTASCSSSRQASTRIDRASQDGRYRACDGLAEDGYLYHPSRRRSMAAETSPNLRHVDTGRGLRYCWLFLIHLCHLPPLPVPAGAAVSISGGPTVFCKTRRGLPSDDCAQYERSMRRAMSGFAEGLGCCVPR
jgi:hypothetical protein